MAVPYKLHSHSLLTPTSLQGAVKHMNKDHTHNLTNIIQAHLNLPRPPTRVTMTAMDFQGFEVTFKRTPSSFWSSKKDGAGAGGMMGVRIPWQGGKINDSKEARVQLVALSEKSEGAVGKTPIVYSPPIELPLSILLWGFLYFLHSNPQAKQLVKANLPAALLSLAAKSPIQLTIPQLLTHIFRAHAVEALLMLAFIVTRASGSRSTVSPFTALAWILTTIPVGFPTFFKFKAINPPVKSTKK